MIVPKETIFLGLPHNSIYGKIPSSKRYNSVIMAALSILQFLSTGFNYILTIKLNFNEGIFLGIYLSKTLTCMKFFLYKQKMLFYQEDRYLWPHCCMNNVGG